MNSSLFCYVIFYFLFIIHHFWRFEKFPIDWKRMCLGTFSRRTRSLATYFFFARVRIPRSAFCLIPIGEETSHEHHIHSRHSRQWLFKFRQNDIHSWLSPKWLFLQERTLTSDTLGYKENPPAKQVGPKRILPMSKKNCYTIIQEVCQPQAKT